MPDAASEPRWPFVTTARKHASYTGRSERPFSRADGVVTRAHSLTRDLMIWIAGDPSDVRFARWAVRVPSTGDILPGVQAFARISIIGGMMLGAACASIAGLEEPDPSSSPNGTPPAGGTSASGDPAPSGNTQSGGPGSSGSPPGQDAAGIPEASAETGPVAPTCLPPKKTNGEMCLTHADCCSNACNEEAKCADKCTTSDFCDPFGDDCCAGTFCPTSIPFRCAVCKKTGETPRDGLVKSCCSRMIGGDGKCM